MDALLDRLAADDDPTLWRLVFDTVLLDLTPKPRTLIAVGRCSHWLAPNSARWAADGEDFAWPSGYGPGGRGYWGRIPEFDWSVTLRWTGEVWEPAPTQSLRYALR